MEETEKNISVNCDDATSHHEEGVEREGETPDSPSTSPKSDTASEPQDAKNERKRSSEEMDSRGFMTAEDASSAYHPEFPPPSQTSVHPVLAPRTGAFMPPDAFNAASFPLSGANGAQSSLGGTAGVDEEPSAEDFARMSRSERKRYREKRRRSEVNRGFDELTAVLLRVNPSLRTELEEGEKCSRRHAQKSSGEGDPNPVLNRVDLISRTIATLERLNREKEDCRARVTEISQAGNDIAAARQAIKDDRVLLMVPFLSPVTRQSVDNTTLPSQQQALGLQAAGNLGYGGASYQNMPFTPMGNQGLQPTGSMPLNFGGQIQGNRREDIRFNQGYLRALQDANIGNGLSPGRQDVTSQRGRML